MDDDIAARIKRGRKAIKLAREKGIDTSSWEMELVGLEALAQAEDVGKCTRDMLDSHGWCLWKCDVFNGDIIVICRDELSNGYPKGYPIYTEYELEMLGRNGVSERTLHMIHQAKKLATTKVNIE